MNELIKITDFSGKRVVSARELYMFLSSDVDLTNVTKWMTRNIENNAFAVKGVDFQTISRLNELTGKQQVDFVLSIDFAKELCMMSQCDKGKQARQYFIECERKLQQKVQLPATYIEALKALVISEEQKQLAEKQVLVLQEQNEIQENIIENLVHTNKTYNTTEIAKELGLRSAIELNKILHIKGIQFYQNGTWMLYSKYSDKGYTETKQFIQHNGIIGYDRKWTGEGRLFILNLLKTT